MNLDIDFRPKTFEEFIGNKNVVKDIQTLLKVGDMPHIMLVGPPGCGKTTLELLIASYYLGKQVSIGTSTGIADFLVINASDERGIDTVRDVMAEFARTRSETVINGIRLKRVVAVREADSLTKEAQHALRDIIERYEDRCEFIFTLNHIEGIKEPALISRCYVGFLKRPNTQECAEFFANCARKIGVFLQTKEMVIKIAEFYKGDLRHMLTDCLEVLRGLDKTHEENGKMYHITTKEDLWKIYQSSNKSVAQRIFESQNHRETFFEILKTESFDLREFLEEYYDLLGNKSLPVSKAFAKVDSRLRDKCSEVVQMNFLFSLLEK